MRLIDADVICEKLAERAMEYLNVDECTVETIKEDMKIVNRIPTMGAEPVVRCKECKHWKPSGSKAGNSFSDMEYIGGCEFTNYFRRESDFCSYGERKEGAD